MRGILMLWLMFSSPVLFAMSGCQWRPDMPTRADSPRPAWVITHVAEPALPSKPINAQPSPLCECKECACENCLCGTIPQDPRAAPVPDKSPTPGFTPTRNKAFVEPVPPKPLTEQQKAMLRPTYQSNESYSEPRRGLFRRWRGGSTSTGASASGSC